MKYKVNGIIDREVTDIRTGEVVKKEETKVLTLPKEPPYVKMYIEDIGSVLGLTDGCKNLLYCLATSMPYDGIITVVKSTRERFSKITGVQENVIKNQLTALCKSGAVKRLGRSEYEINPNYFAKGDWPEIRKRQNDFEMRITYTKNGRKITGKAI